MKQQLWFTCNILEICDSNMQHLKLVISKAVEIAGGPIMRGPGIKINVTSSS